jgi:peptidoglycan hydrolase-like protein with peptidoglycan-binding domain
VTSGRGPSRGLSDPSPAGEAHATAAPANISRGAQGQDVTDTQALLNRAGAGLKEDGKFGPRTDAAVRAFQQQHGLQVDGIVGPETRAALGKVAAQPQQSLRWGASGAGVQDLQSQLNQAGGYNLKTDGEFGNRTYSAIRDFQSRAGLPVDGFAGPNTRAAIDEVNAGTRQLSNTPQGRTPGGVGDAPTSGTDVPNNVAQFDRLSKTGQRNQMAHGRITVNGNTYDFRSGGGGRGNLPPGDYTVTRHLDSRSDKRSMMVDGVGYSFALSNKYDPRVNATRSLLRVHPDGGGPGTIGCIGIVGDGNVQRQFRADMLAEIERNGGSYTLSVRE